MQKFSLVFGSGINAKKIFHSCWLGHPCRKYLCSGTHAEGIIVSLLSGIHAIGVIDSWLGRPCRKCHCFLAGPRVRAESSSFFGSGVRAQSMIDALLLPPCRKNH